jgi:hypothetical protein
MEYLRAGSKFASISRLTDNSPRRHKFVAVAVFPVCRTITNPSRYVLPSRLTAGATSSLITMNPVLTRVPMPGKGNGKATVEFLDDQIVSGRAEAVWWRLPWSGTAVSSLGHVPSEKEIEKSVTTRVTRGQLLWIWAIIPANPTRVSLLSASGSTILMKVTLTESSNTVELSFGPNAKRVITIPRSLGQGMLRHDL